MSLMRSSVMAKVHVFAMLLLSALLACKGGSNSQPSDAIPATNQADVAAPVQPPPERKPPSLDLMGGMYQKVADDSIDQYELTKKHGSKIEICVHAGMVAAAFLQAKSEAKYAEWKAVEKADCAKAGMPQP